MHRLLDELRGFPDVETAFSFGESYHVNVKEGARTQDLADYLTGKGHAQVSVTPVDATIEDCFMALMRTDNER